MRTKAIYTLKFRTGYGERCTREIEARDILEAMNIARNYLNHQYFGATGYIVTRTGRTYHL